MAIGVEIPSAPLVFVPKKDWSGQLVITNAHTAKRLHRRSNSGGRWESDAEIIAHIKNVSTGTVVWAGKPAGIGEGRQGGLKTGIEACRSRSNCHRSRWKNSAAQPSEWPLLGRSSSMS